MILFKRTKRKGKTMDKKEFSQLVMALKTYYPRENLLPNTQAMELWYQELCDIPYNVAVTALREHVLTSKWSPTIADIRERATAVKTVETYDWADGWKQVIRNINKYGVCIYDKDRLDECMESFDEITRQVVKRLGWKELCLSDNVPADRARFKDVYEQLAKRKKEESQIPESLRMAIEQIRTNTMIENQERKMIGGD